MKEGPLLDPGRDVPSLQVSAPHGGNPDAGGVWRRVRTPQSNCRGPAALANEASGRRGRASPSGWACDHRRHPGARLALAGCALRVPVAPASGGLSRSTAVGCTPTWPAPSA